MCDCYRIEGPWIGADPNCPTHGVEAQRKRDEACKLRTRVEAANDVEDLKELLLEILDLIEE